jgi:hypothetical protein
MSSITNKLLKEAIADAEAVRETAIANAKLVLEESITPQVKEMISRRLRVEAEMDSADEEMDEAVEKPFEEAEAEGSADMPADTSKIGTGDNTVPSTDAFDKSGIGDGGENQEDSHTDWYDDWNESDFDLAEIIKELEDDIAAFSDKDAAPADDMTPDVMEGDDMDDEIDLDALTDDDDDDMPTEGMADEDDEEMVDLEEILAELAAEDEEDNSEDELHAMKEHVAALQDELGQHKRAVKILSGRLQEVNLLNTKLLFTNKIFRKEGLNNDQKVRIIESFDRATTLREVKLVYTALVENLSVAAKSVSTSRKKVVTEGFASKPSRSTAPVREAIVENTVAKRLQELAGIIN